MHRGYIKLWRKTLDNGLLSNPNAFTLFSYFLMRAAHEAQEIINRNQVISLAPGQVLTSLKRIGSDIGLTSQSARTSINFLKKLKLITEKVTNKFRVVTIVKWTLYQSQADEPNKQLTNKLTSSQQSTNKQTNNIEELKELKEEDLKKNKQKKITPQKSAKVKRQEKIKSAIEEKKISGNLKASLIEWTEHKEDIKNPMTPRALKMLLNRMSEFGGESGMCDAIIFSISSGYRGVFAQSGGKRKNEQGNFVSDLEGIF